MRRAIALIAACLGSLVASDVRADPMELPFSTEISVSRIAADLRGSQIQVVFDAEATPQLTVTDLNRSSNDDGFVLITEARDLLEISQPHGPDRIAPPLLVRLVLRPDAQLRVTGDRLTIDAEIGATTPAADSRPAPGRGSDPPLRVSVKRSLVRLRGIDGDLNGTDSRFDVQDGRGSLAVRMAGGVLEVRGFDGSITIDADLADAALSRISGAVDVKMRDGVLDCGESDGRLRSAAEGATLLIQGFRGDMELRGQRNRIEVRGAPDRETGVLLEGSRSTALVTDLTGALTVDIEDGQLTLEGLDGDAALEARGRSDIDLTRITGDLGLRLIGARAAVEDVQGALIAEIEEARLELAVITNLELTASRATVVGAAVMRRAEIRAVDSELDFDLAQMVGRPRFELSGESAARVTLPNPCLVQVDGDLSATAGRLAVSGCQIQKAGARAAPASAGGPSPLVASAKLEGAATLSVRHGS